MPRAQDYSQSTIYHIRNIETKEVVYVGSTTNFTQRKSHYKYVCSNENSVNYNQPIYTFKREHGGFSSFEVVPKLHLCLNNKIQLVIAEQTEIDKYNNLKNCKKAYLNDEEREHYKKDYYEENKEKLLEQQKDYYEENKEKLLEQKKDWYEENKEKIAEKQKEYREANKEKIALQRKIKVTCECGCEVQKICINQHIKSSKHLLLMTDK